ncbi:glycoside hydrolase family 24 [Roseibium aquae]|uniref:Glycoside hydrolase family 24 n=2 Tax=Roseibium aquae TaxID=1323746 RepID=A0A916TL75_9HYPH|nr:glycoside hydrolase family 24 [Roseibium aquae]
MSDFDEVRFPDVVARGALGGPERRTEIVELTSGFEERNTPWADSRRKYDVGSGIRHPDHLSEVIAFFEARSGRLRGFRFKDWSDFTSSRPSAPVTPFDQVLGAADGARTSFQLIKAYSSGSRSWIRRIAKPVAGTVLIAVDGAVQASGWSVDPASGTVTFDAAPASGTVTAGFAFDVPCRFDTDLIQTSLRELKLGEIRAIPIVEVRV